MKKEPRGVVFKLFSDSLNMKIFRVILIPFPLVKRFERAHLSSDNLSLFQPHETNIMKKDNIGVVFKFFSDSLNMQNHQVYLLVTR
jgi:hypothetical protein